MQPPLRDPVAAETGWKRTVAEQLAFLRRRMTGDYQVDDFGYDPDFTDHVIMPPLRALYEKWFRVDTLGMENIPDTGGALLVANHSGTVAVDALMSAVAVREHHPRNRPLRMLGADLVFQTPFLGPINRKVGNTLACNPDAERLLSSGELVAVFPEGFKGVGKPYSQRYKLQRFGRGGFVTAALQDRRADHPGVDRRRRGDLSADRQHQAAGPGAGVSVLPGHPDIPVARTARRRPAAQQVDHRVRRADPDRRATPTTRRTTRWSSSTSPTGSGRPSSRRSTDCCCAAATRSSADASVMTRACAGLTAGSLG